jgi:NitT/TauT family transport system substrate-binding protein
MRKSWIALALSAVAVACAPAPPSPAKAPPPAATAAAPAAASAAPTQPPPATATTPPAPVNLQVGVMNSASDAGFFVAQERGLFREQGIDVEFVTFGAAAQMLGPLGAAQIDAGGTALTPGYLNAFARGIRVFVVADKGNTSRGWGYQGVLARKTLADSGAVRGPADLRDRKLGIPSLGSGAEVGLDRYLRGGGIGSRDTDLTLLAFPDMPAAFASGAIDGAILIEPFVSRIVADGSGVVLAREDEYYPDHQVGVVYFSDPFATERADVARRFTVAYLKAVREYNDAFRKGDAARRAEVVQALVKHTTVKDPALYERMTMPGLNPDGEVNVESLREDYEFWLANGYQEERVTVTDLVDHSFVRYAVQQLGPYR